MKVPKMPLAKENKIPGEVTCLKIPFVANFATFPKMLPELPLEPKTGDATRGSRKGAGQQGSEIMFTQQH